jgi:hypothetical protein
MPIEQHPALTPPADSDRLWRYMDFTKYLSLLDRSGLYFCNAEALARTDPHEGMLAQPNFRHRDWTSIADLTPSEWQELGMDQLDDAGRAIQFWSTKNSREYWSRRRFYDRRTCLVNCWHINGDESAGMWAAYAHSELGVAVVSDYPRLVRALAATGERIYAGRVQYVDFAREPVNSEIIFPIAKRLSFSHERELRLIYWDMDIQNSVNERCARLAATMFRGVGQPARTDEINWNLIENDIAELPYPRGRSVNVDLGALVSEIRVSPLAEEWLLDLVRSVSARYSLSAEVRRSDLLSSPFR